MMDWKSMLAIYFLFWAFSAFLVLPFFGRRLTDVDAAPVPGQAESAPVHFPAGRVTLWVTIVATVLFVAFQLNYSFGWVRADDLNWLGQLMRG
jgi:predicted secreted protein